MDLDMLTALLLFGVGLVLLWLLIIRRQGGSPAATIASSSGVHVHAESANLGEGLLYSYGASFTKGRRAYMEDRYVACGVQLEVGEHGNSQRKTATIYGVFDGHGGDKAADFCRDHMKRLFDEATDQTLQLEAAEKDEQEADSGKGRGAETLSGKSEAEVASNTLYRAMCSLDTEFLKEANAQHIPDGTTAVVALLHGDQCVVGNIGDSRAVLVTTTDDVIPLSDDHKPDRPDERRRVEQLNGFVAMKGVYRVMGVLAVSRAVGDLHLKQWVSGEAEMREERSLRRANARYLVIASDGLWDVVQNDEVPQVVSGVESAADGSLDTSEMARVLTQCAYTRGSMDNITVVVVDLSKKL